MASSLLFRLILSGSLDMGKKSKGADAPTREYKGTSILHLSAIIPDRTSRPPDRFDTPRNRQEETSRNARTAPQVPAAEAVSVRGHVLAVYAHADGKDHIQYLYLHRAISPHHCRVLLPPPPRRHHREQSLVVLCRRGGRCIACR